MFTVTQKMETGFSKIILTDKRENAVQKYCPNAAPYSMRLLYLIMTIQ